MRKENTREKNIFKSGRANGLNNIYLCIHKNIVIVNNLSICVFFFGYSTIT